MSQTVDCPRIRAPLIHVEADMRLVALFIFLLTCSVVGCGKSESTTTTTTPSAEGEADVSSSSEETTDGDNAVSQIETGLRPHPNYPVPELPPEGLLKYINQLAKQEPRGDTRQAFLDDQFHRAQSRLVAADRIILSSDIEDGLMEAAVRAKLDALRLMAIMKPEEWDKNFKVFAEALIEKSSPRHALMARVSRYEFELDRLGMGLSKGPEELIGQLKTVLSDKNAGQSEFLITQYAGVALDQGGFPEEATKVLRMVGTHFSKSESEELAKEANDLLEKTSFREKVIAALEGNKPEVQSLFVAISERLRNKEKLTLETLDSCLNAGQMLEYSGKFKDAGKVFTAIKRAFSEAEKDIAEQAVRSVDYAQKRLGVIGNSVEIEGVQSDGSPFDWSKLKGKVVLVDFWASRSAPWLDEVSNLRVIHDRYHKDGFEVVGVNLDHYEDRDQMYEYLRQANLPWVTVFDESVGGFGNPNAVRYGVEAVPFVMLVGRDGKVSNIHLRGPELSKRVEELVSLPSGQNATRKNPRSLK